VLRLVVALFAVQAGFHAFTASLPLALADAGVPDPLIGVVVGIAAVVQVPAALLAGGLVDRFGGVRVFVVGGLTYLVACAIVLLPGVDPEGPLLPFAIVRAAQGIGIAAVLPAGLSLVPRLAPREREGFALSIAGSANNLTLVVIPPVSLLILAATSLDGVAAAAGVVVAAGLLLVVARPFGLRPMDAARSTTRRFRPAFRRSWSGPLAIVLLFVAHWGLVLAYLPQRADAAGAQVGLLFVADGLAIMLSRIPTGWLADRMPARTLVLAGLALTGVGVALLVLPPTTILLVVIGTCTGAGGGLVLTPVLVELSRRSDDADRGSAFSLLSAALAAALGLGSLGAAPLLAVAGFEVAAAVSLAGIGAAAVVALADRRLALPAPSRIAPPVVR
jgi:MFS family permease